jgi:hypothetical protein
MHGVCGEARSWPRREVEARGAVIVTGDPDDLIELATGSAR